MTQLAAGATITLTLPLGSAVDIFGGQGQAMLTRTGGQPTIHTLNGGKLTIRANTTTDTVFIRADQVLNYQVYPVTPPNPVDPATGAAMTEAVSRTLQASDNGRTLECTATITLTVPVGLPANFGCQIITNGTTSVASDGTALLNGATATLTRAAATAANTVISIVAKASASNSYAVTGI